VSTKRDEYLEALWRLQEEDKDSLEVLQTVLNSIVPNSALEMDEIESLASEGMVDFNRENMKVALSLKGSESARDLIRKHRLAERLLHDILGIRNNSVEAEACRFEHLVAPQVVDAICTLLGHPRECPHGMPIPEGECCKRSEKTIASSVVHLSDLSVGETRQIAYVNCQNDAQVHRLDGLQLKPGVAITLHQKYPSYVLECEGGMIAIDEQIAGNICLWKEPERGQVTPQATMGPQAGGRMRRRRWRRGLP